MNKSNYCLLEKIIAQKQTISVVMTWWSLQRIFLAQCFLPINNNSISSKAHIHIFISECVRGAYIELVQFFQGSQKRSRYMYSS